jgi:adenylate cyclase class 2
MEIEIKIRISEAEFERLRISLSSKCRDMGELELKDIYFSHPCYDFAETDEALRLRMARGPGMNRTEITYKGKRVESLFGIKSREEISALVDDAESFRSILKALGFSEIATVEKIRRNFDCGRFIASLDKVKNLGDFIEMEGREGCASDCLLQAASELGIIGKIESKTYLELILERTRGSMS